MTPSLEAILRMPIQQRMWDGIALTRTVDAKREEIHADGKGPRHVLDGVSKEKRWINLESYTTVVVNAYHMAEGNGIDEDRRIILAPVNRPDRTEVVADCAVLWNDGRTSHWGSLVYPYAEGTIKWYDPQWLAEAQPECIPMAEMSKHQDRVRTLGEWACGESKTPAAALSTCVKSWQKANAAKVFYGGCHYCYDMGSIQRITGIYCTVCEWWCNYTAFQYYTLTNTPIPCGHGSLKYRKWHRDPCPHCNGLTADQRRIQKLRDADAAARATLKAAYAALASARTALSAKGAIDIYSAEARSMNDAYGAMLIAVQESGAASRELREAAQGT